MGFMHLRTLGKLALESVDFPRPKLLLLLAYLAIEGAKEKRHLHELFWSGASDPATSLRMALAQFRKVAPDLVLTDDRSVSTKVSHDLTELQHIITTRDPSKLEAFYMGEFLQGFSLPDWSTELEEWVYSTREFVTRGVRGVYLKAAELEANQGRFSTVVQWADKAFLLTKQDPTPEELERLYPLLLAGDSSLAGEAKKQLLTFGLEPSQTRAEAQARFFSVVQSETKPEGVANNLPRAKTSFVGRDPELLELEQLLLNPEVLLITLLGMGGIGKTRLALELAAVQVQEQNFCDGVYVLPLESLTETNQILLTLAQTLQITVQQDPFTCVTQGIGKQRLLLILDNFEHLVEAALLVSQLLSVCPYLKIVVTSRERLNLEEEHVMPLSGLTFPKIIQFAESEYIDAIRLFVQRAKRARLDFELTTENLPHVIEICRLVEGSPLGIELAAVWLTSLPVAEIAHDLAQNIRLLETNSRNIAPRHQSIKAVFEYSWKLLKPREQRILAQLSVFRGGFTRQAASSIADTNLGSLSGLVGKSVLRLAEPEGRYDFHPLLLEYANEKLVGLGEQIPTRNQHAQYFLELVETSRLAGLQTQIKVCQCEYDNLLIALAWSQENNQPMLGLKLALLLGALWQSQGYSSEGIHWLRTVLSHKIACVERIEALLLLSRIASVHGEHLALALESAEISLELAQHLKADEQIVLAYLRLSLVSQTQHHWTAMQNYGQAGLTLARQLENPKLIANALWIVGGNLAIIAGDYINGRKYLEESLSLNRSFGSRLDVGLSLNNLGFLVFLLGDLEAAKMYLEESLQIAQALPDQYVASVAQDSLSAVLQDLGELEVARQLLEQSLLYSWQVKNTMNIRNALENFANLAVLQGQPKRATQLWGAAERFQPPNNSRITMLWYERNQRFISITKDRLGETSFQTQWNYGKTMKLEAAVSFALEVPVLFLD
jgi:predicted ATPase